MQCIRCTEIPHQATPTCIVALQCCSLALQTRVRAVNIASSIAARTPGDTASSQDPFFTFSSFFCSVFVRNSSSTSTCSKHMMLSGLHAEGSTATATQHLQMLLG